ncbi:TPA: MFS transporter [Providencia rettgeri]|uniref:MFS transporter n=1 Tax=Providencia TaxID=586 RepID=UPI001B914DF0|nr:MULTISPECIES: MFS transporter [Providencia]EMB5787385.1 MFS transporter [Providencia rettgeri]HBC7431094.1 MFS transporter [Providencia rettgeri]
MFANLFQGTKEIRPLLAVVSVFLGAILSTLFIRMFSLSLADIRGVFALDVQEGTWLNIALNAAQLASMTLTPWFMVVFGAERILMATSATLLGIFCCFPFIAGNYGLAELLVVHSIIGFNLGVYLPMTISLALRNLQPSMWLIVMAAYSLRVSLGMDVGVGVSGAFIDIIGWQWLYWGCAFFTVFIFILAWKGLPLSEINQALYAQTDWGGMILKICSLLLLYVGVVQGETLGWSDSGFIISSLVSSVILFGIFMIRALYFDNTFAHPRWLTNRNLCICFIIACLYGVLMLANSLFIPSFLSSIGGLKSYQIGEITNFAFIVYLLFSPVAVWLAKRIDARLLMIVGVVFIGYSCVLGMQLDYQWRIDEFVPLLTIQSIGECLVLIGLISSFVVNMQPQFALHLGAYVSIARVLMPALAGALMNTYLRITFDGSFDAKRALVQTGEAKLSSHTTSIDILSLVTREAHVGAFINGFNLTLVIAIAVLVLILFLKPAPPNNIVPSTA